MKCSLLLSLVVCPLAAQGQSLIALPGNLNGNSISYVSGGLQANRWLRAPPAFYPFGGHTNEGIIWYDSAGTKRMYYYNGTANVDMSGGSGGGFSLSTVGSSGPATYVAGVLNIPQYSGGGSYTAGRYMGLWSGGFFVDTAGLNNLTNYYSKAAGDGRYALVSGSYSNPSWITGLAWPKISGTPATLGGYGITDAYPLSGNPSGFITASALSPYLLSATAAGTYVSASGSYSDPLWIVGLTWPKISGTPTTLGGYGITDAYPLSGNPSGFITASALSPYLLSATAASTYVGLAGSYSNPSWIVGLAWPKISGTPTTAAGYGITDVYTKSAGDARYLQSIAGSVVKTVIPVSFYGGGDGA